MSWLTILRLMAASACPTFVLMHLFIRLKRRHLKHLLFALTATGMVCFSFLAMGYELKSRGRDLEGGDSAKVWPG